MTFDELNESIIEKLNGGTGDYVVRIDRCYIDKYNTPFDQVTSYEVFSYDGNCIVWFNDWFEGQDDCNFSMLVSIRDLIRIYNMPFFCIIKEGDPNA